MSRSMPGTARSSRRTVATTNTPRADENWCAAAIVLLHTDRFVAARTLLTPERRCEFELRRGGDRRVRYLHSLVTARRNSLAGFPHVRLGQRVHEAHAHAHIRK